MKRYSLRQDWEFEPSRCWMSEEDDGLYCKVEDVEKLIEENNKLKEDYSYTGWRITDLINQVNERDAKVKELQDIINSQNEFDMLVRKEMERSRMVGSRASEKCNRWRL